MPETTALLLAAGRGTRLRPLTDRVPKCLVEIAGRPLLDYWVVKLDHAGVRRAVINTHHVPEAVRGYIEEVNQRGGVQLEESYEPTLLGSAGTIANNARLAEGSSEVLVVYADNLSSVDLAALVAFHRGHSDPVTMLLFRADNPSACGIATLDAQQRVVDFVEKPEHPKSDLANAGVYVLSPEAYREVVEMRAFDLGFEVLPRFVGRMRGLALDGYHRDIGTPEALEAAIADVASGVVESSGPPR